MDTRKQRYRTANVANQNGHNQCWIKYEIKRFQIVI